MDRDGELVRRLLATGNPETLRTGLLSMGWPESMATEQASSMRLGLDPAGIEQQIARMASQYPRESPGPYETLLGVKYGRKPSPREEYRKKSQERQR